MKSEIEEEILFRKVNTEFDEFLIHILSLFSDNIQEIDDYNTFRDHMESARMYFYESLGKKRSDRHTPSEKEIYEKV